MLTLLRYIFNFLNDFSKWASEIESEFDAYVVRQKLEDYKIAANEDLNTFRRLLHLAEADHYAFFQVNSFYCKLLIKL